jgi:hypothetical protein
MLAALVMTVAASGQYVSVVVPTQPAASPVTRPEPRVQVADDPLVIFQNLIGSSSANRRRAISQLGWKDDEKFAEDPSFISDARFYRVNLDDDPEMEAILKLKVGFYETRVLIFRKTMGQWWRIGEFSLTYMWVANEAEDMLELRDIVGLGYKDIVIRLTAGGTDIQKAIVLSIYRLYKGPLYRTFETTEEFAVRRLTMIDDERNRIYYPEPEQDKDTYIVVRNSKQFIPESDWGVVEFPPKVIDCIPYRWDPAKYLFVVDRSATGKFCRVAPQP